MSAREKAEDGYYHIRFAFDGKVEEVKITDDKRLVNYLDSQDVICLAFDENGIVVDCAPASTYFTPAAKELYTKQITFSPSATQEIKILTDAIQEILNITACAYDGNSIELAAKVEPLEQVIDGLIAKIRANHIRRLQKGICTIEGGFILADLLNNYERISDHCSNVAVAIIEVEHNSFDTHKYLNGVKYGNSVFNEIYDSYEAKYSL